MDFLDVLGPAAAVGCAAVAAIWVVVQRVANRVYTDLQKDRERTLAEHKADRERYRGDRADWTRELLASREERAECRAKLAALEAVVQAKLEAAQPRDSHGRFEAERG